MEIIKTINLNSNVNISFSSEITSRLGFLFQVARKTPVYLVDEDLMDKIYPPHKKIVIDEVKIKRNIEEYENKESEGEDDGFLGRILERSTKEINDEVIKKQKVFIAIGVYVHQLDKMILAEIEKLGKSIDVNFPAVFICPERIKSWAKKLKISQTLLSAKVLYHELGHAYIHNPNRTGLAHKIIEESYCNAIAFSRFSDPDDIEAVMKAISEQPFEYRGYTYFTDSNLGGFPFFPYFLHPRLDPIEFWIKMRHFWMEIYHLWRIGHLKNLIFCHDIFRLMREIWRNDRITPNRFFDQLAYAIVKEIIE